MVGFEMEAVGVVALEELLVEARIDSVRERPRRLFSESRLQFWEMSNK
ncbi:hypothetical protein [Haladaptatus halobius]|nr:hypothetical protein [Haladaptatus halobius]